MFFWGVLGSYYYIMTLLVNNIGYFWNVKLIGLVHSFSIPDYILTIDTISLKFSER